MLQQIQRGAALSRRSSATFRDQPEEITLQLPQVGEASTDVGEPELGQLPGLFAGA